MKKVDEGVKVELLRFFHENHPAAAIPLVLPFKVAIATGWLDDLQVKKKMERMEKGS